MTDSYKLSCLALPCLALVRLDLPYLPGFTSVMVLVVVVVVMVMVMVVVWSAGGGVVVWWECKMTGKVAEVAAATYM